VAADFHRAVIYCYDWDVHVRAALTAQDVRERFYTKIEIVDPGEATKFAQNLPTADSKAPRMPKSVDVRLVIDLYSSNGRTMTYFASQFTLYSDGGRAAVPITEAFKNKFRIAD
jgi:hypothetical protein